MSVDLSSLNPPQLEAVKHTEGPLLVLAGAGSGKTRVITYRMAVMLHEGIPPSAIRAVTFTNKAASEMASRVSGLWAHGRTPLKISTFHAFGVEVLRASGGLLGYRRDFSIFDQSDTYSLVKEICREQRSGRELLDASRGARLFSRIKSRQAEWGEEDDPYRPIYREYNRRLRLINAVDFDDLILLPVRIWEEFPEERAKYRHAIRYLLVDEFQDTSALQYRMMHLLAEQSRNLCVVGDDDQSIYSWRGADGGNLLRLERDFPERREIKLEQNYRSTDIILQAANGLIANNTVRKAKKLWTSRGTGETIVLCMPEDEREEGRYISSRIRDLTARRGIGLGRFAVLVRTNGLTRAIEEALRADGLPYRVSGGMSFFQRMEIKDVLAYLRVAANPDDDVSLLRILNVPRRGFGRRFLEILVQVARGRDCSLYSAMSAASAAGDSPLQPSTRAEAAEFLSLIGETRRKLLTGRDMAGALRSLIEQIDYPGHIIAESKDTAAARRRQDNVEGLVGSLAAYERDPDNLEPSVFRYLNLVSLSSREEEQSDSGADRVNLMTIHAAKGLEFDTVFVAGVEEGLMPHARSIQDSESNLEEERRLFYVAVTRAMSRLYLTAARSRRRRGRPRPSFPSPFLEELPKEILQLQAEEEAVDAGAAQDYFRSVKEKFV